MSRHTSVGTHAAAAVCLLATILSMDAAAQDYPASGRELRHIIPWGAGGATDTAMRGFMRFFETRLGIPVVTENIPGGLSAVGLLRLKTARPDGYTIGTLTYDVLTLDAQRLAPIAWEDFDFVGMITEHPSALIVKASRFDSLDAFRAESATSNLKVGNVGSGGIWHQHAAAMARELDIDVTHVPYEAGSGAQLAALLGGEVDANVASLPASLPYVQDGTLRVLAVMAETRDPLVPDAPTFLEKSYDVVFSGFRILAVPRRTPAAIRAKLESTAEQTWNDPEFQSWARDAAIGATWRDGEQTRTYMKELATRVEALMTELGLGPTER